MDNYIGQILDNRYEILERIGIGGMAVVYKARCHRLNRLVAVKILKEELATDDDFRRRFHTESQAVAMLSHPNIVAVYDVSRSGNIEYIVMELIEGITLKQYINRKGLLNWKEALHFATQITKALSHAHSRGIIHRDIKPHNIMILKDGSVKVADFGIARLLSTQNTLTQDALGSVHYISPEQAKGGHVDARSDIYSVGVVLYEMLTSRLPFVGDSAVSVAIQHISAIPLMPRDINPDIPEGLETITMHAMEPDLNARYANADELLVDLEEFRKNPGTDFAYSSPEASVAGIVDNQATRPVPTEDIVKSELSHAKVTRTPKKAEMTRNEYRKSQKRASKTSLLIGVFGILLFLIVVFVFMWNYVIKDMLSPEEEKKVTIPNFHGKMYEEVLDNSEYTLVFEFNPSYQYNDAFEEGMIFDQSPTDGSKVLETEEKIAIDVTVSSGQAPDITMPDFYNKDIREVKNSLIALGLKLEIVDKGVPNDDMTSGHVIETVPEAGETLISGMTVYIEYSTGPEIEETTVPNVTDISLDLAKTRLDARELKYRDEYVESDEPAGMVLFQSVAAGETVEVGTVIVLHVSMGPPEIDETDEPTDTPPVDTDPPEPTDTTPVDPPPDSTDPVPSDTGTGEPVGSEDGLPPVVG